MSDTHTATPRYLIQCTDYPRPMAYIIRDTLTDTVEFTNLSRESAIHIAARLNRQPTKTEE